METLFAYDSSRQALVMRGEGTQLIGIPVRALLAAGWSVDETSLARCLPRFGKPVIELAHRMPTTH